MARHIYDEQLRPFCIEVLGAAGSLEERGLFRSAGDALLGASQWHFEMSKAKPAVCVFIS